MAAPSGIVWGSTVGSYGRIGIYKSLSSTNTTTSVTVEVWFWSKYSVSDSNNTFYFNNHSTTGSATTDRGSVSISTTSDSGGWSTTNQKRIASYSYEYTRGTSAVTRYLYAKLANIDRVGGTMYASTTFSVPKLASYTVAYNANGGSGAPSSQTKWYGKTLTLSKTKPTRTGYSFQGWATSSSGSVAYAAGASYTANSAVTLYAVWKANTYTVTYNANGGSGAPSNQTKTYGTALTLSSTKPTRANYNFKGWGTSASATTVAYAAGASYTKNAAITLYAIWELAYQKPIISAVNVSRTDANGIASDSGTYIFVIFNWRTYTEVAGITVKWVSASGDNEPDIMYFASSGTSGSIEYLIGNGEIATDQSYKVMVTVMDSGGETTITRTVEGTEFTIDFLAGGKGVAMGKPAELESVCDIAFQTRHYGGLLPVVLPAETDLNDIHTPNTYIGANTSNYNYVNCPLESGTFSLEVTSGGEEGQVRQVLTKCHKTLPIVYERWYYGSAWGDWLMTHYGDNKVLWGGDMTSGMYMTSGHTATLTEAVSLQKNGIVLAFSYYNGAEDTNYNWQAFYVPKTLVSLSTAGHTFQLARSKFAAVGTKYLYIYDTNIKGHDDNSLTGTSNGITYANNKFVLRYVFGV